MFLEPGYHVMLESFQSGVGFAKHSGGRRPRGCRWNSAPVTPGSVSNRGRADLKVSALFRRKARDAGDGNQSHGRKHMLIKYVQDVNAAAVDQFVKQGNPQVVNAMQESVSKMVGTLPPAYFKTTINTNGEHLMQLFYSFVMSGYLLRNIQYRYDLQSRVGSPSSLVYVNSAAPAPAANVATTEATVQAISREEDSYAPGVQKNTVEGDVVRWHYDRGVVKLPAKDYMEILEAKIQAQQQELNELKFQLQQQGLLSSLNQSFGNSPTGPVDSPVLPGKAASLLRTETSNELVGFLQSLPPASLTELGVASSDVQEAIKIFLDRLMGTGDMNKLKAEDCHFTNQELSNMLFWLMVVGYTLRTLEVNRDMDDAMDSKSQGHGLLPGF